MAAPKNRPRTPRPRVNLEIIVVSTKTNFLEKFFNLIQLSAYFSDDVFLSVLESILKKLIYS